MARGKHAARELLEGDVRSLGGHLHEGPGSLSVTPLGEAAREQPSGEAHLGRNSLLHAILTQTSQAGRADSGQHPQAPARG